MKVNTLKIEGRLLSEIHKVKPPHMSFAAFVRHLIEKELTRQTMEIAAKKYKHFLETNQKERSFLNAWEKSDLETIPKKRREKK